MTASEDDVVRRGLRIVGRRYGAGILQNDGHGPVWTRLDALGAGLLRGANGAGDIGLCDYGGTSGHGALSVVNDAFHTPTAALPSSSNKFSESSNKFV
jgi:hypothetical protein